MDTDRDDGNDVGAIDDDGDDDGDGDDGGGIDDMTMVFIAQHNASKAITGIAGAPHRLDNLCRLRLEGLSQQMRGNDR